MPATASVLFPSGEDANPLHKRLPAEVVTRRRREPRKVIEKEVTEDVQVDLKAVLALKPDARPKWLSRACKMAEDGRTSATDLYNIISSRKFVASLPSKVGRKLREIVYENMILFSDKQQRYLKSEEWTFNTSFGDRKDQGFDGPAGHDDQDERDPVFLPHAFEARENSPLRERREREEPRRSFRESGTAPASTPAPVAVPPVISTSNREARAAAEAKQRQAAREKERAAAERALLAAQMRDRRPRPEVVEPETERWTVVAAASGQEDRLRQEALRAEERARRKARDREEQDRWLFAEAETVKRKAQQEAAKKRKLEDEVDGSLMLLEQLGQQHLPLPSRPEPVSRPREARGNELALMPHRGLSRSRSISVQGSPSPQRGKRGRSRDGKRRRKRSRSERGGGGGGSFNDALRRRLAEREANDTTRIPVVDPGHAKRWS